MAGQKQVDDSLAILNAVRLRRLVTERVSRRLEGLRMYRPMPMQERFHSCHLAERILRGSNRSGKSLAGAVEVARAVTGQDPHNKYPAEGRCYVIGFDGKHLSKVMWPLLSRAGAFWIIRDAVTGQWRTWRPQDPLDHARLKERKPAPPLIPPRMIQSISWENKKEGVPSHMRLNTGWEVTFYSSKAAPQKGTSIDLAWCDEEIENAQWYSEVAARLVDRNGKFFWTATPQAGTEQLYDLHERAHDQYKLPPEERTCDEFVILLEDNDYLTRAQKRDFAAKMSDEEKVVRIGGEFALLSFKVFPEYSDIIHGHDFFHVPAGWTRYLAVDPGRQVCAVLFAAVSPAEIGDQVYLYDELYLQNCDAEMFGDRMRGKCADQIFEGFIIDHQGGQVHETGTGITIESQYADQLRHYQIKCNTTGSGFQWGDPNVRPGIEAMRGWLRPRDSGTPPRLKVMRDRCPNFVEEIKRYRYKKVSGIITDEPEARGRVHAMAAFRYLAMHGCRWVSPKMGKAPTPPAVLALKAKLAKKRDAVGGSSINLGIGA